MTRRVVVTGLGAITPLGSGVETSWRRLLGGNRAGAPIGGFDTGGYSVTIACEAGDFEPSRWIEPRSVRRMDRFAQFAVAAAREAQADAGLDIAAESERVGASVATSMGGFGALERCYETLLERGPDRVSPFSLPAIIPNGAAAWVSIELGTRGPLGSQCTACAASKMAIGEAFDAIRLDRADAMLCGGADAPITPVGVAGYSALRALSRRNDDPASASRPFDADRDGFVLGEGAGILVLEELEHARARGVRIYAEVLGYGVSSDAGHITDPDPTGSGPARAITMALADAGIRPEQIDYINAHGTSTPVGDASETRVLKLALGEEVARATPISSTKGATGHCLGAAGAIETIFCTLAIRDGVLPPTANLEHADPDCDLDYIPIESRPAEVRIALSNSFGFGGHNACVVLGRLD